MQVARGLHSAWRRRELASDQRTGAWSRGRTRDAHLRVIRRTWKLLLVVGGAAGALGGACLWFIPNAAVRTYTAGLLTATILGFLAFQVTQMAGTSGAMMGEIAEQWTAQELRKLKRRGWRVVNHLMLRTWDIDHVLVGPGGIFAIETKWSSRPWELDPPEDRVVAAVRNTKANARDLSLWQPIRATGAGQAQGVLVLWGGGENADGSSRSRTLDGVIVVPARAIDAWRDALPALGLDASQVEACWQALEHQVGVRDSRDGPPPDSALTILIRYFAVFAAALIGFVATADLLAFVDSYAWWPVVYLITLGSGFVALRIVALRRYAAGWLAGVLTTVVAAAVILVSRIW